MTSNNLKSIIVTGANTGLGFNLAKTLCGEGYDVILACRSEEKGRAAVTSIKYYQPDALATAMKLDLVDFENVREFVTRFQELDKTLYALVNNAGIMMSMKGTDRQTTPDGLEVTMATNYLGPFLLTHLLLDDLKSGCVQFGEARVVNVASSLQDPEKAKGSLRGSNLPLEELNFDNINLEREGSYSGINAYMNSKSALIMFTYTLADRLKDSGVTVNSVCPGFVPTTDLGRNHSAMASFFVKWILPTLAWLTGRSTVLTIAQGVDRLHKMVTSEELCAVTGQFYCDGAAAQSKGCTNDKDKQTQLWDYSMKTVSLEDLDSSQKC